MSTIKGPRFSSFIVNVLAGSAMLYGTLSSVDYAQNIALGLCWFLIAVSPLMMVMALSQDPAMAAIRIKFGSRPRYRVYIGRAFDVAIALALAAVGWWWTFAGYAIHAFISLAVESAGEEEIKKMEKA